MVSTPTFQYFTQMFHAFERDGADAIKFSQYFYIIKDGFKRDAFAYIYFDPTNVLSVNPMLSKEVLSMVSEGLLPLVAKGVLYIGFEAKLLKLTANTLI